MFISNEGRRNAYRASLVACAISLAYYAYSHYTSDEYLRMKSWNESYESWTKSRDAYELHKELSLDALDEMRKATECMKKNSESFHECNDDERVEHAKISSYVANASEPEEVSYEPRANDRDRQLMSRVCEYGRMNGNVSPLCNDWELYFKLKAISDFRLHETWFPILLGITYAESHIGVNFAMDNVGGTCYGRNNWGGAKYYIRDDNSRDYRKPEKFGYGRYNTKDGKVAFVDDYGCNLYPFDSVEEYFISKANGIRYGFPGCVNATKPIECIAYKYVGNPNVAERSWIERVAKISM